MRSCSLVFKLLFIFSFSVVWPTNTLAQTKTCFRSGPNCSSRLQSQNPKRHKCVLSSWVGDDCCREEIRRALMCNPKTGRIVALRLQVPSDRSSALYMKGTLSPLLGELQFLEALVTSGMKQIGGSIPETLSKLVHLTQLVL
ncbi:hypothetical protein IFM89_015037 [Coptis chinensis]|uniref:Uncharacterized protein n=1 Tax=Coptis chinensis TaxID=261450 RepID=A0A835HMH8_9MAGN|nr:hypothetical protein IFM89_015037 [Coptis chinensis]